jgi:sugar O-acyltransferase (sialic acid O-acetyltransferase NeuD family)
MTVKKVVILGAGGHARSVLHAFRDDNIRKKQWDVLGFVDDDKRIHEKIICGVPVLGGFEWFDAHERKDIHVMNAVASPKEKKNIVERAYEKNLKFCALIHPSVWKSEYVKIGEGTFIAAGNILTTYIEIGSHVIINLSCTIGHDSIVEDLCTIAPGVHLSGNAHIKRGSDIGAGSVILQGRSIGPWSVAGAGSVVNNDIPPSCTAAGVPARVVKRK